jgi:hypothetical protein
MLTAAAAGVVVAVVTAAAGVRVAATMFSQSGQATPTTAFLAVAVAIGFAGTIVAGYVCARLAPDGRRLITMALLMLAFLAAAVVLARVFPATADGAPAGFLPLVTLLGVIGAWAGVMVERAITTSHAPSGTT